MLPAQLIVGFCWSRTVTLKVQLEVLPPASVAVQVTVLMPLAKLDPEAGTHRIEPPGQLSVSVARKLTLLAHWPGAVLTVIGPGQPGTGRSVSLTVTVKVQLEVLPLASGAGHTTLVVPFANLEPDAGTHRIEPPGQLSVSVARKLTLLAHCPGAVLTVIGPGQLIVGGWLSTTVTLKVTFEVLPPASVAVHTTLVVPIAKLVPDAGTHRIELPGQLSVNVARKLTLLAHWPGAVLTVIGPGQLIVGGWLSTTVTLKVQFEVLPLASVAVHTTVVVPIAKLVPDAGTHRIEPPGQLSVNVARKLTLLAHWPGAVLTVIGPGQLIVGGWLSTTVTLKVQFEVLPLASVAGHTTLVVPLAKLEPDAGTHRIEPPGQLSVSVARKLTLLAHWPGAVPDRKSTRLNPSH